MALPKYRISKAKGRSRRANYLRITSANLSECPQCGAKKMPHRACPECGFYKGKKVIFKKEKKTETKKQKQK
ncbi:MAG: 50S ribosomal protein L32 [Spirochaetes bacterium]|nr:50S ribosomal protein L32 [Spirochaetota bacterium]